eukprot:evm.model.NODE_30636_length_21967_cov_24.367916.4
MEEMKVGVTTQDGCAGSLKLFAGVIRVGGDAVPNVGVHAFVVLNGVGDGDG